jgi:hypothetical protein
MPCLTTVVASSTLSEPVHDTVPRQLGRTKVRETSYLTCRVGVPCISGYVAVGHEPPFGDHGDDLIDSITKVICGGFLHKF